MQTGLRTCHSPKPLFSLQAVSVGGSYQSCTLGKKEQPKCKAVENRPLAELRATRNSQRFQWMQLWLDGSFSLSPNLPELCQPSWLVGLLGLSVPSQSPREVAKPQQIWWSLPQKKLVGLRGSVPAYPLLYCQRNARQVNRTEITSQRAKNISLEVDTILFTNSFCSAMKEIDPALSLIHKLPLMKLLELLKGGTDESGLVTVLPHWP